MPSPTVSRSSPPSSHCAASGISATWVQVTARSSPPRPLSTSSSRDASATRSATRSMPAVSSCIHRSGLQQEAAASVGLDLPIQRGAADLQHLGGAQAITFRLGQGLPDLVQLGLLQPGELAAGNGALVGIAETLGTQFVEGAA